ncbi:efflux RND transporter periplasmic adaptor subunit [Novipirellula caenicola]
MTVRDPLPRVGLLPAHFGLGMTLLLCGALLGCKETSSGPPEMPPPTVTVAKPVTKKIVEWDAYTGRLEAVDFVEVRARVSGYLKSIHFKEGQIVDVGDLLFVIDPRPFEAELNGAVAALNQAQSQLKQARASLENAKAKQHQSEAGLQLAKTRIERARALEAQNAVSIEELDQRAAEFQQAEADLEASKAGISAAEAEIATAEAAIESARAGVETAELNLDYTQVRAPVSGRISRQYVTEGNLVSGGTATSTLLTTITSVDPIYCTFDVNEQDVLKYIRLAQIGERKSSREAKNPVFLGLVDESGFPHEGHMDFVDNHFDVNTASMRARGVIPNHDRVLLPGMFARIRIPGSAAHQGVLVPDSAIGTDQSSQYVYIVVDNVIQRRGVKLGPMVDGLRVVREGLSGSETLVIQGLLQSRPEMTVQVKPGKIEAIEDGLPDDYQPLPPEKWMSRVPDPQPVSSTIQANAMIGLDSPPQPTGEAR